MKYEKIKISTASSSEAGKSILIIYTGGTFGMARNEQNVLVPFDFGLILEKVPSLQTFDLDLTVISFKNPIDSSNINIEHWQEIGNVIKENYELFDGFVILHGTDTMAFTASALSYMLGNLNKPVIITGAQLPISSRRTDGRENLIAALEIASAQKNDSPVVQEVCIYFGDVLLRGNRAKKFQSDLFDAFESRNYPVLANVGITIDYNEEFLLRRDNRLKLDYKDKFDDNVAILTLYPGITQNAVEAILDIPKLKGVIMQTYGTGNAPTYPWFLDLIKQAVSSGINILNVTQCNGGHVLQGKYKTSRSLADVGVLGGNDITMEAGVTKVMHVLGNQNGEDRIRELLTNSLCGEIS